MGGGGIIIRRNAIKATLSDPLISGTVPEPKQARMQEILAMDCSDWTKDDEHFLIRCLADAIDCN